MAQDFNQIMEAAKKIQEQMKDAQHKMHEFTAQGGNKRHCLIEVNGKNQVRKVTLNESFIKEEPIEFIEEMIASAFNKAIEEVESEMKSQMMNMTKDLGIDMDKLKDDGAGDSGGNDSNNS